MNFWDNFEKDKQLIIAHRGARAIRAENTISAFSETIGKYDFVEFDVGFSRDGVAVIIHDSTFNETSNAKALKEFKAPYRVIDYDYSELLKLDFGTWFIEKDPFKAIKRNLVLIEELENLEIQRILTLKELLSFLKQHKMPANIEIKDASRTKFDSIAVTEVLKIVKETDMQDMVSVSSFNHDYLKQIHEADPKIDTAALEHESHHENLIVYLKKLHVRSYNPNFEITTQSLVKELNSAGFFVNVYTVNEKADIKKLFDWGVKSVFTDFLPPKL